MYKIITLIVTCKKNHHKSKYISIQFVLHWHRTLSHRQKTRFMLFHLMTSYWRNCSIYWELCLRKYYIEVITTRKIFQNILILRVRPPGSGHQFSKYKWEKYRKKGLRSHRKLLKLITSTSFTWWGLFFGNGNLRSLNTSN